MNGVIIFWFFFFALTGILIGVLIGRRIERRSKPPVEAAISSDKPIVEANPGILRAGRTPAGKIWLEMNGKHMGDKTELDPDSRQRLLNLMLELRPWLEMEKADSPAPVAVPVPPVVPIAPNPGKKEVPPKPVMKSIIEQINDVLQARLATSTLKDRDIQLIEGSNGSVVVQDGINRYEGLEAVPDTEITTLIRAAITEWEKSTK